MGIATPFLTLKFKEYIRHSLIRHGYKLEKFTPRPMIEYLRSSVNGQLIGAEVGVYRGEHAYEILNTLPMEMLYLIDPYELFEQQGNLFDKYSPEDCRNTAKRILKNYPVRFLEFDSETIADFFKDGELDFVYIDANHNYPYIRQDIELWLPKVKQGGVIGGHDYSMDFPGVVRAVNEAFNLDHSFSQNDWWYKI